jgi:carboxyl-terminal processing protease
MRPVLSALALAFAGCAPEPTALEVFDAAWGAFDARYGPFDQRDIDWDAARATWRPTLAPAAGDDTLWDTLTGMLAELDDGHVQLYAPGRAHWYANAVYRERIGDERFDEDRLRAAYLDGGGEDLHDDTVLAGRIRGAEYVWLRVIGGGALELEAARQRAERRGAGLIVDLRHDGGGDFTWARAALSAWTDRDVPVFRSRTRSGPVRGTFDAWTDWAIPGEGAPVQVPVAVLTDRFTISAGERATLMLRELPGVTLIGEPTNGSIATMIGQELPNRWYVTLPVQEVEGPRGEVWEGLGVPPDLEVLDDLATPEVDEVLEAALALVGG